LQQVLEQFEGTILLVSHDRYLIDHLATQVWELHKHHLEIFEGSYAAMLLARQQAAEAEKQAAVVARSEVREDFVASKQARADERRRARVVADAEGRVHTLEVRLLDAGGRTPRGHRRAGYRRHPAAGAGLHRDAGRVRRGDGGVGGSGVEGETS
jgi:ATPase subunit of ABC transporter with duplicated ATPase domains